MSTDKGRDFVQSIANFATDLVQMNSMSISGNDLTNIVGSAYRKSFDFQDSSLALAELAAERERIAQAEISKSLEKFYNEQYGIETHQNTTQFSKANISISDILTFHPLHQLAHQMDDSGEGFHVSKCDPGVIDLDFCPREVIEEVNRRHGNRYYPHVHADNDYTKSILFYEKSATNLVKEEFSRLVEEAQRIDYANYRKGLRSGPNRIVDQLEGGANRNYAGGQLSPALIDYIKSHHGRNWKGQAILVPNIQATYSTTREAAAAGADWDYEKSIVPMLATAASAVAKNLGPKVGQIAAKVAPMAGNIVSSAGQALKTSGPKLLDLGKQAVTQFKNDPVGVAKHVGDYMQGAQMLKDAVMGKKKEAVQTSMSSGYQKAHGVRRVQDWGNVYYEKAEPGPMDAGQAPPQGAPAPDQGPMPGQGAAPGGDGGPQSIDELVQMFSQQIEEAKAQYGDEAAQQFAQQLMQQVEQALQGHDPQEAQQVTQALQMAVDQAFGGGDQGGDQGGAVPGGDQGGGQAPSPEAMQKASAAQSKHRLALDEKERQRLAAKKEGLAKDAQRRQDKHAPNVNPHMTKKTSFDVSRSVSSGGSIQSDRGVQNLDSFESLGQYMSNFLDNTTENR